MICKKLSGRPKGTGSGKKLPGTDIRIKGTARGADPKLIVHPKPRKDSEAQAPEPNDELSKHKFPPPKKNPIFRKVWGDYIDSVSSRENFSPGHLNSLKILCDLFVDYEELSAFVKTKGRSYLSIGRSGNTWKLYPEVSQLKSVQHQINVYIKQLGLVLKKDEFGGEGREDGWD